MIKRDQDVILEPTVGGKSGTDARSVAARPTRNSGLFFLQLAECSAGWGIFEPPLGERRPAISHRDACLSYLRVVSGLAPGAAPTVPGGLFVIPGWVALSPFLAD